MKYNIMLKVGGKVKPMKDATPEEKEVLEKNFKAACEKYLGLRFMEDDDTTHPGSERVAEG